VQDKNSIATVHYWKVACALSIGTEMNNRGRLWLRHWANKRHSIAHRTSDGRSRQGKFRWSQASIVSGRNVVSERIVRLSHQNNCGTIGFPAVACLSCCAYLLDAFTFIASVRGRKKEHLYIAAWQSSSHSPA